MAWIIITHAWKVGIQHKSASLYYLIHLAIILVKDICCQYYNITHKSNAIYFMYIICNHDINMITLFYFSQIIMQCHTKYYDIYYDMHCKSTCVFVHLFDIYVYVCIHVCHAVYLYIHAYAYMCSYIW